MELHNKNLTFHVLALSFNNCPAELGVEWSAALVWEEELELRLHPTCLWVHCHWSSCCFGKRRSFLALCSCRVITLGNLHENYKSGVICGQVNFFSLFSAVLCSSLLCACWDTACLMENSAFNELRCMFGDVCLFGFILFYSNICFQEKSRVFPFTPDPLGSDNHLMQVVGLVTYQFRYWSRTHVERAARRQGAFKPNPLQILHLRSLTPWSLWIIFLDLTRSGLYQTWEEQTFIVSVALSSFCCLWK